MRIKNKDFLLFLLKTESIHTWISATHAAATTAKATWLRETRARRRAYGKLQSKLVQIGIACIMQTATTIVATIVMMMIIVVCVSITIQRIHVDII